jgi:DNA-binding CsgD family transcriptional regulator
MKRPIYVRPLSDAERETLKAGLRSPDAFTLRRSQILLKSAEGKNAYQIARFLGCNDQTVRNVIHRFNDEGLQKTLRRGSSRPHAEFTLPSMSRRLRGSKRCSTAVQGSSANPPACGHWSWPLK